MKLPVTVTRILYPPATDAATATGAMFYILATSAGICKGKMSWRPRDNEALILEGEQGLCKTGSHAGEPEFAFSGAMLDIPTNPRDALHYCIERTPGAGAALESAIWQHSGANWQNIKPGDVPRLGGALYEKLRRSIESLNQNAAQASVVAALMGHGATQNMAQAAYDRWKDETLGVVQDDPFRLAELEHYGFAHIDRGIRQSYGITDEDPRRVKSAVIASLRKLTDDGSTVVGWPELFSSACALLGGLNDLVFEATRELLEAGTLKGFKHDDATEGVIALRRDYENEKAILDFFDGVESV